MFINGLFYGIHDVNDVIDIFTYAKLNLMSESAGDGLLQLLKDILRRHSESIGYSHSSKQLSQYNELLQMNRYVYLK